MDGTDPVFAEALRHRSFGGFIVTVPVHTGMASLAGLRGAAVQDMSLLKALAGEPVDEATQGCRHPHGGMGFMRGAPLARLRRDGGGLGSGGGATEVMRDEAATRC